LKTSQELVRDFQAKARGAAQTDADQRRTIGGSVGGFVGAVGAGLDPRYNLFNTLTLGVGGFGKTAVQRIGTEALGQSAIEAVNEFTGGRSTREMRGLDSSWEGTITRIGFAGVGGGVIRGLGEGVGAGVRAGRRWFSDTPLDPAPPPPKTEAGAAEAALSPQDIYALRKDILRTVDPKLAETRIGSARVIADLDDVSTRLQAWDGEAPGAIKPRMDTAMPREVQGVVFSDDIATRSVLGRLSVDEIARKLDPDAFRVYDDLASKVDTIRTELQQAKTQPATDKEFSTLITEANNKVSELTDAIGNRKLKPKEREALVQQRDAAIAERDSIMSAPRTTDTPRQAQIREEMQKADYKMRDMLPVINRAYARARGEFVANAKTAEAVKKMVSARAPKLADEDAQAIIRDAETELAKSPRPAEPLGGAPITARASMGDIAPGTPFVEAAIKVVERDAKLAEETLTAFRDSLDSMLKEEKGKVAIGNHEFDFKDRIEVPGLDGEGSRTITVKELLDEIREADYDAKAVKTCSI
jgi:hypothetical protein